MKFCANNVSKEDIKNKMVLEVGSFNMNGSFRSTIRRLKPSEYTGVDVCKGPGVDFLCNAYELVEFFGENSFDVIVSTEMLEHVEDWKKVIRNFKKVLRPNGMILITTRSPGFGCHLRPDDFWRYSEDHMRYIFSDMSISKIETDRSGPGVFVKAYKPVNFTEKDISNYKVYSIEEEKKELKKRYRKKWKKLRRQKEKVLERRKRKQ